MRNKRLGLRNSLLDQFFLVKTLPKWRILFFVAIDCVEIFKQTKNSLALTN